MVELSRDVRGDVLVSVVVPIYNPVQTSLDFLNGLDKALSGICGSFEILVVDDGSEIPVEDLIELSSIRPLRIIRHPSNLGKGAALRTGFSHSRGLTIAFIDGDGDIHPSSLLEMVRELSRKDGRRIIVGSKTHHDSQVDRALSRKLASFVFQVLVSLFFRIPIMDTQTGVKVFAPGILEEILPELRCNSFLIDVEILAIAIRRGVSVTSAPVSITSAGVSAVSLKSLIEVVKETAGLWARLRAL